ncbi:hypothetical protein DERP_014847 [Dermatophagoides pteronyssinus]|uniref:Transmembrane protein n=1 Tax=Dermatophagoides pteronyssinus TaxID=6956 RepID=A0ABQ8JBC3_DERPT|nr:hypothetical protein DERP_014847 [Dermatophagoides pteronyssinus]
MMLSVILWLFTINFVVNSTISLSINNNNDEMIYSISNQKNLYKNFIEKNFQQMNINSNFSEKIINLIENFFNHQVINVHTGKVPNIIKLEQQFSRLTSQFIQYSYENNQTSFECYNYQSSMLLNTDMELICAYQNIYNGKQNLLNWLQINFRNLIITFFDRIYCPKQKCRYTDDTIIRMEACKLYDFIEQHLNYDQRLLYQMIILRIQQRFPICWNNKLIQILNTGGITSLQYVLKQLCQIDVQLTSLMTGKLVTFIPNINNHQQTNNLWQKRQDFIILNIMTFYLASIEQFLIH